MKELEHYDPYFDIRQERAKAGKEAIGEFLYDEATDPLTYLGLGGGALAKGLGKGMFAALMAGKHSDADAMMFGGKYLPKEFIAALEKALDAGESADKIFRQTGFFKDPRGKWRKYVPDKIPGGYANPNVAETIARFKQMQESRGFLKHLFESPALKEDPNLGTIPVGKLASSKAERGTLGEYNPVEREINAVNKGYDQFRSTLGHETQHAVQQQGNLPIVESGANTAQYQIPEAKAEKAFDVYRKHSARVLKRLEDISKTEKIPMKELLGYVLNIHPSNFDLPRGVSRQLGEELSSLNKQYQDLAVFRDKYEKRILEDPFEMYKANPGEVEARVTGANVDRDFLQEGLDALNKAYDEQIGSNKHWYLNHEDFLNKILQE